MAAPLAAPIVLGSRVCGGARNFEVTTVTADVTTSVSTGVVGYGAAACAGDRRRVGRVGSKG